MYSKNVMRSGLFAAAGLVVFVASSAKSQPVELAKLPVVQELSKNGAIGELPQPAPLAAEVPGQAVAAGPSAEVAVCWSQSKKGYDADMPQTICIEMQNEQGYSDIYRVQGIGTDKTTLEITSSLASGKSFPARLLGVKGDNDYTFKSRILDKRTPTDPNDVDGFSYQEVSIDIVYHVNKDGLGWAKGIESVKGTDMDYDDLMDSTSFTYTGYCLSKTGDPDFACQ